MAAYRHLQQALPLREARVRTHHTNVLGSISLATWPLSALSQRPRMRKPDRRGETCFLNAKVLSNHNRLWLDFLLSDFFYSRSLRGTEFQLWLCCLQTLWLCSRRSTHEGSVFLRRGFSVWLPLVSFSFFLSIPFGGSVKWAIRNLSLNGRQCWYQLQKRQQLFRA